MVCKLKKSLYGLRQSGRSWNKKLDAILRKLGAIPTTSDPCLYYIKKGEDLTLIATYVDDIIIASKNENKITNLGNRLSKEFDLKDLGEISYCLGIEFKRSNQKIHLRQTGYINELLERFGMSDCKPIGTPMETNLKLSKAEENPKERLDDVPYRELIGSLTYLSVCTRPDISYTMSYLSQFNNNYGTEHWKAAKRVLRYLKGTIDIGLCYDASTSPIKGYVDADWGGCIEDRRSYTGYSFILGGSPISWDARKQRTVALSSTEAEYMALTEAAKESIYLRNFLTELHLNAIADITVFGDNMGALKLAENSIFHGRTKHIDIKHHFIREALRNGFLKVSHIPTEEMVADVLTKSLGKPKHLTCLKLMGITACTVDLASRGSVRD